MTLSSRIHLRDLWLVLIVASLYLPVRSFCADSTSASLRPPAPSDPIAGRSHWAFRPLASGRPQVHSDRSRTPIDDFILARLRSKYLEPSPDAERAVLLRRLYFQLIGLPPTPEQRQAFVQDNRPDALVRVVESLLQSPQFGERWGRHWLDLARYADSNGLDENFLFREAWRYRNWVIDAINADVPFDRFILEQIAGDLLPFASIEQRDRQRIGAGFLVIGPKVLLGNDPKNQRMEIADEQIETLGRSVLGLTLGCARCHDHKFDPVPTADYYALAGILASTQVMEQRYMLGEQRVMERLVGLGSKGDGLDETYEQYWRELPKVKEKKKSAESALGFLEKEEKAKLDELLEKSAGALVEAAKDSALPTARRIEIQKAFIAELDQIVKKPPSIPPRAMIPIDAESPADEAIRRSGQFNRLGEIVPRGFLRVISDQKAAIPSGHSGRLELAHWLTDINQGAGHLTARVLANRVWHHMLGRGLVRTADNFGRTGEAPTHPELLDYLSQRLIDSGWSIKAIVREIALSRTFAMSSGHNETAHAVDPENTLLWRAHRRRLDPESLRDAMLAAAGMLDLKPMGSSVWYLDDQATAVGANMNRRRTDFPCRSVYLPVIRNDLPELFQVFDFADPHATTGARSRTMVATQNLYLLNNEEVMDLAEATARQHLGIRLESRGDRLFERILCTSPSGEERSELLDFARRTQDRLAQNGDPEPELRAWSMVCHALFSMSRFQFLE